jgi:hypothetical protein
MELLKLGASSSAYILLVVGANLLRELHVLPQLPLEDAQNERTVSFIFE